MLQRGNAYLPLIENPACMPTEDRGDEKFQRTGSRSFPRKRVPKPEFGNEHYTWPLAQFFLQPIRLQDAELVGSVTSVSSVNPLLLRVSVRAPFGKRPDRCGKKTMLKTGNTLRTILFIVAVSLLWSGSFIKEGEALDLDRAWKDFLKGKALAEPSRRFPYEECFRKAAEKYNLPVSLLLAVGRGESDYDPKAKSEMDCHGIMQIQWPGTAKHLGIDRLEALYDPCTNIDAGARYVRQLLDRYAGNLHLALAAYNYGPGRINPKADSESIPQGARWYSSYIYDHLCYVVGQGRPSAGKTDYREEKKLEVNIFNKPYRAEGFCAYLREKIPSLQVDWFKMGLGRFQVVVLYRNATELNKAKTSLKNLGFFVPEA